MFSGRNFFPRGGAEAAVAFSTRYQESVSNDTASEEEQRLRQPISASEVDQASQMIFQRAPSTPSDYVFSPSATVPSGPTGGRIYPRLLPNQVLRGEVLAMGHRLALHPGVQEAIVDDLLAQGRRVPSGRRSINPNLLSPPGTERGLARLVDMLESEDELSHRSSRSTRSGRSGGSGFLMLQRDRRGLFDYDDEQPLPHLHLDPRVSEELEVAYAAMQEDEDWEPWQDEDEKEEDKSEGGLSSSRLSDGILGSSCSCHSTKETVSDEEPSEGTCWKDVLSEYECDICLEVLVGVHVLDNCGHHFCGACMETWIDNARQGECPVCRTPVDKLVPVRKMDEMIAKAVDAAAPSRERDAWYERRAQWEGTARRRQEARAAGPFHSVVHAQGATAAEVNRPGAARWYGADASGGGRGRSNGGRREEQGGADDERNDAFRPSKWQTALAVAVMLVLAAFRMRTFR